MDNTKCFNKEVWMQIFNVEMVKLRDHFLNSIVALVTLNDKLLFCVFLSLKGL